MFRRLVVPLFVLAVAVTLRPALAQEASKPHAFSSTEKAAIEQIIRDYLVANPEVILEAIQALEQRQKVAAEERQRMAIRDSLALLERAEGDPVLGNPDGDVTVVEFFDYRCPYCRRVAEPLRKVVEADGNVRLVMKEYPILGPDSLVAARAALAGHRQDGYEAFHFALMQAANLDEPTILRIAGEVGLDVDRLQKDMDDPAIEAKLQETFKLAESLNVTGTPAFVIGEQLVPGAIPARQIEALIAGARRR
jgi:protein-disulfide isomerase